MARDYCARALVTEFTISVEVSLTEIPGDEATDCASLPLNLRLMALI